MTTEIFSGAELRLARVFNGLALEDLATRVGKTRQYLFKLESGASTPTGELALHLAQELNVEVSFFYRSHSMLCDDQLHFRKLGSTRVASVAFAVARGELVRRVIGYLQNKVRLPPVRIPSLSPEPVGRVCPESAAEQCRDFWELGQGPIDDTVRLAESIGVVVTNFHASSEIDAHSVAAERPFIVRNDAKESTCRQRFDICHELAHLVLHQGIQTGDRRTESEANQFASAFLIPRAMMLKLFPRPKHSRLDWRGLSEFKLTWKVSKAAILYRARKLELLSEAQYKTGIVTLKRHSEAIFEKEDHLIPAEVPDIIKRSLYLLADRKGLFADDVAKELRVMPALLRQVVGFELPANPAGEARAVAPRPLRLVVSNV